MKHRKLFSAVMSAVMFGSSCCLPPVQAATVQDDELPCTVYAESIEVYPNEQRVGISVYIKNNIGYSSSGIRVWYNEAPPLTPHLTDKNRPEYVVGEAADEVVSALSVNEEAKLLGFGAMTNGKPESDDGLMFTAYFDVAEDAEPGLYPIKVEVDKMLLEQDGTSQKVLNRVEKEYYTVNVVTDGTVATTEPITTKKAAATTTAKATTTKKATTTTAKTTTTKKATTTTAKTTTTTAKAVTTTTPNGAAYTTTATAAKAVTTTTPNGAAYTTTATAAPSSSTETAVVYGDKITANPGDKRVAYNVMIRNNPGFGPSALRVEYPEGLTPVMKDDGTPDVKVGDIAGKLSTNFAVNAEKRYIGMVSISAHAAVGDGTIFTLYFDVAPEMKADEYPIKVEVLRFADVKAKALPVAAENGSIKVQSGTTKPVTLGDTDCSGKVDVADAVLLARYLAEDAEAGITPNGKLNADTNRNGTPDAGDTILILRFIARLITKF